jgi:L-fuconolactonase
MVTATPANSGASRHLRVRPDWLASYRETILEPDLPIVDPHHHLWERAGYRYFAPELLEDVNSGHRIEATVFVQSRSMLRADGPVGMASLGEVEFANGAAAIGASGQYGPTRICAGIVGGADLSLGASVEPVLQAMVASCGQRLCGIRNAVVWHSDPRVSSTTASVPPGLMANANFRRGAALLARFDLVLDVWAYHTQLDDVYDLARAIPHVTVVINHFGGPIGVAWYVESREFMLNDWRRAMRRLAQLPNTRIKLGGGGMPVLGLNLEHQTAPPNSMMLANAFRPYVEACIEWFGVHRCMFESNFPVDKASFSYHVLWNAFKRICRSASQKEKTALFSSTASSTYRLTTSTCGGPAIH